MKIHLRNAILVAAVIVLGTIATYAETSTVPVKPEDQGMDMSSLLILLGGCTAVTLIAWFSWHSSDRNNVPSMDGTRRKMPAHPKYSRGHHGMHVHHSR